MTKQILNICLIAMLIATVICMPASFAQTDSTQIKGVKKSEETKKVYTGNISFSSDPNMNIQPPPETNIPSPNYSQQTYTPSATYSTGNSYTINNPFQHYPDEHYRSRINALAANCQLPITYNKYVRPFIEVYTVRKRHVSENILGKVNIYFPMIERIFLEEGLPLDLKYLAATESALNQEAVSRAGAVGLWQFMRATGRENGLTVNSYMDERKDPEKSTRAAARFFKKLYRKYGDWFLVIAAYNCGPGNVNKAIRRTGKYTYWGIRRYLPRETRGYVPSYIACVYFINYYYDHYLNATPAPYGMSYANSQTVPIYGPLNLQSVANITGTNYYELEHLNAALKKSYVPSGQRYDLRLPTTAIAAFHANKGSLNIQTQIAYGQGVQTMPSTYIPSNPTIITAPSNPSPNGNIVSSSGATNSNSIVYVSPSDTRISGSYTKDASGNPVPVHRSTTSSVYNGVNGSIHGSGTSSSNVYASTPAHNAPIAAYTPSPAQKTAPTTSSNMTKLTYTVKKGDNVGFISEWYDCGASKVRRWNRIGNTIRVGQKLKIYKDNSIAHKYQNINSMTFDEKQKFAKTGVAPKSSRVARSNTSGSKPSASGNVKDYRIKKGDSLWLIAQNNPGNSIDGIRKLNNLSKRHKLMPGSTLKIYQP